MKRHRPRRPRLDVSDLPALASFARAYLHQDFVAEYEDVAGAATAFCRDASSAERAALAEEVERVITETRDWTVPRLGRFFTRDLGASWTPKAAEDLSRLLTVIRGRTRR